MAFDFKKFYSGSMWDLTVPFDRKNSLPIDRNSLFPSYALAAAYASKDQARITTAINAVKAIYPDLVITNNAYVGQILTVIENNIATVYVIEADYTLKAVGTAYNDTELRNLIATKLDEVTGKEAIVATTTENSVEVSLKLAQGDKAGNVTLTQDANGLKADIDLSHNHDDIYVKQETGKGLSTNDLTDALKANYDAAYQHSQTAHAPADAQANVIEAITVNGGEPQIISNKTVDITVPTKISDLTNDSGFLTAAPEYSIVKDSNSGDYAAIYHLTKNGTNVGAAINIPKDLVVKSGSVVDNNIVLVLNDEAKTEIKIPVGDLVEYVTSGSASGDMVFVTVDPSTHKVTATITDGTITIEKLDSSLQAKVNKTWEEVGVAQGLVNGLAGTGRTNETVKGNADAIAALINSLDNYVEKQQFESYVTGDEVTSSTQIYNGTIPSTRTDIQTDLQLAGGKEYSIEIESEGTYTAEATVNDDGLHSLAFKLSTGTQICSFTETSEGVYTLGANASYNLAGKDITLYKLDTTPGLGIELGAEVNAINNVSAEFNIVTDKDNDRVLEIAKIAASKIVTGQDSSNNDITLVDALNNIYTKDEIGTLGKPAEGKENEAGYKPAVPGTGILGNIYSKDEVTALIQNVTGGQSAGEVLQKLEEYQASNDAIVKGYEKDGSHVDGLVDQVDALIKVGATKVETSSTNGNIRINDEEKTVYTLPTATANTIGGVKSADAENKISVDADGIMEVKSLNVNKLVQTTGEWLILNGGNASLSETPDTEAE